LLLVIAARPLGPQRGGTVGFGEAFAENKHAFSDNFPSPSGSAYRPYWLSLSVVGAETALTSAPSLFRLHFLHLPAMPNRFIARITVIAFHK
jgi:hypothetical protein